MAYVYLGSIPCCPTITSKFMLERFGASKLAAYTSISDIFSDLTSLLEHNASLIEPDDVIHVNLLLTSNLYPNLFSSTKLSPENPPAGIPSLVMNNINCPIYVTGTIMWKPNPELDILSGPVFYGIVAGEADGPMSDAGLYYYRVTQRGTVWTDIQGSATVN